MIIKENFLEIYSNLKYTIFTAVTFILFILIFNSFTDYQLIKGNLGAFYLYVTISLQFLISLLFSIFLPISVYKYIKFSSFSIKENSTSFAGTFLGIIVAGCPACSITLASYIGLGTIISFLPYHGLELKIIAVPMLIYANYSILKDLNICKIK